MVRITLLLVCCGFFCQAQDVKIFEQKSDEGRIVVMVRNMTNYEQSIQLAIDLKGMTSTNKLPMELVVPPNEVLELTQLIATKPSYGYSYQFAFIEGDVTGQHEDGTIYHLPYRKGKAYRIDQGYLERPTHMNKYALDFNMEEGEEICAIRNGRVIKVVQDNKKGCPDKRCARYDNFIHIKHDDGSIADYSHLMKDGALVAEGTMVKAGQPIAKSGSTGWATGPHLHLEVYIASFSGQKSVKAKYQLDNGTTGIPQSGKTYSQELDD